MALLMGGGTKRASESEVMSVPQGEFTKTFKPISHGHLLKVLQTAVVMNGLEIVTKDYSLNKNGKRMFGVWSFDAGNGGMRWSMGFRNSVDKSTAIGICAGVTVTVCGNMMLSGDFTAFRKHTSGLDDDELIHLGAEAVGGAIIDMTKLHQWQEGLHEIWIPARERKSFVYDLIKEGVISPTEWKYYHDCLDIELDIRRGKPLDGTHSMFNLHGAATRLLRDGNLLLTHKRLASLKGVCDEYIMRKAA